MYGGILKVLQLCVTTEVIVLNVEDLYFPIVKPLNQTQNFTVQKSYNKGLEEQL